MTLNEAVEKWNISRTTILNYIADGMVYGVTIEEGQLNLPEVPRPKKIRANCRRNSENIYRWLLKACIQGEYVNAQLFGITRECFRDHLECLVSRDYISLKSGNYDELPGQGCQITPEGLKLLQTKRIPVDISLALNFNLVKIM